MAVAKAILDALLSLENMDSPKKAYQSRGHKIRHQVTLCIHSSTLKASPSLVACWRLNHFLANPSARFVHLWGLRRTHHPRKAGLLVTWWGFLSSLKPFWADGSFAGNN